MAIRSSVIVVADTLAELTAIDASEPVVYCLETGRFRVKNGSWSDAFASDLNGKANSVHAHGTADISNDSITYAKIQNISATDKVLGRMSSGSGDAEEIPCTAAGRALIDDADAAAQRTTLGLGTLATQNGTFSGTSSNTNTGDQTITLTGNVTGSGTGSFAATIANDAVTYAKIQNVSATDRVLGRVTAGAGDVEEVACTAAGRALIDDADATAQRTTLGLGTLATQNGTFSGASSGTNTGDQTLSDATISTSDITTNNASASKHGFLPKLTNTGSKFLRDDGTFQTIAGGGDMLASTYDPDVNGIIALAQLDTLVERTTAKNAASGYAGLSAGSKLTASQMSAVIASSDLTNDSALEKTANKNAVNGYAGLNGSSKLNGVQQVYGSGANTACEGTDVRLSDARTPLAHTHPLADITNEGALAAKNTVATADIDNDAVTYAKLQNVTDARLLGRSAGSSGDAHEITVGSGLSLNAGALTATGGGGGVSQMIVPLISDAAGITWTNMPAAVTFFGGSHRFATKIDLTNYTQVRLLVNKQGTAGASASVVRLRYRTAFDTTVGNWLIVGASEVQVAVNVTNTVLDSGWINLVAGAKADVFVVLDGSGGDGVLDPVFGSLVAQFR